jgi:hypothetical protein
MSEQQVRIDLRRTEVGINGQFFPIAQNAKAPQLKAISEWLKDNGLEVKDPTGEIWGTLRDVVNVSLEMWENCGTFPPSAVNIPVVPRRERIRIQ